MRGLFVTFEGGEGSGKTTQIELLAERLRKLKYSVITVREPGETFVGQEIRKLILNPETGAISPITEVLLFFAARKELINQLIKPALSEKKIVLCDRFFDSTIAYQGYAQKVDLNFINNLAKKVCGNIHPDRTIFLNIPVKQGIERAVGRMAPCRSINQTIIPLTFPGGELVYDGRGESRFEDEAEEFHKRVREGFMDIAKLDPKRVKVVDAQQSIEEVHEAVFNEIEFILPDI